MSPHTAQTPISAEARHSSSIASMRIPTAQPMPSHAQTRIANRGIARRVEESSAGLLSTLSAHTHVVMYLRTRGMLDATKRKTSSCGISKPAHEQAKAASSAMRGVPRRSSTSPRRGQIRPARPSANSERAKRM